ncbi:membrane dipeptidase-domain-containing protein [Sparassis latifolia]
MSAEDEQAPLLGSPSANVTHGNGGGEPGPSDESIRQHVLSIRVIIYAILTAAFVVVLVSMVVFWEKVGRFAGQLPKDPNQAAQRVLDGAPIIDGHIDLPILTRERYSNNISAFDLNLRMPGHVDIPRLREGRVGGFFWSTYMPCSARPGKDFMNPTWLVRDTLEQIDVVHLLIDKYPDTFELALTSNDVKSAISRGKIAGLIGIEGGHQIGNSIAVLRQMYALGVRYMTLTHSCHNAFADSCGISKTIEPYWGGLSPLGYSLVTEMNRLGMLVDISHTSDVTAKQVLKYSKAPVIWSHSSARAVRDVPRNVPDDVLKLVGTTDGLSDAVIMVNFAPDFVAGNGEATLEALADHIDHIASITGRAHVGIGSDFDGIGTVPVGLEDVSKYPDLIAEMYRRGWNRFELAGLTGRNFLRIMEGAERVAAELHLAGFKPSVDWYNKRDDL